MSFVAPSPEPAVGEKTKQAKKSLTLRTRLLIATGALMAVGIIVCGTASVAVLRAYLLEQVDQRLLDTRGEFINRISDSNNPFTSINLSDVFIGILDSDGTQSSRTAWPDADHLPDLSPEVAVNNSNGDIFTVSAQGDRSYRYRVVILQPSDGAQMLVLAIPTESVNNTINRLLIIEGLATVIVLALLLGLGYVIIRRDLAPLEEMTETAGAIGQGDLTRRVSHPEDDTEVGRLGFALNGMLGQIEASFAERQASEDRLRRFAADASHELRTPLTAIRGYAELHRQGAVTDEDHLKRVMQRIETEAARMGVMVEDLLLLARLDQGRPLEMAPVEMSAVIADVVSDAHAIAPGRHISVDAPEHPLFVNGDASRLHQVLTNLVSNALIHTPEDSRIAIIAERMDGSIDIKVRDEGPGMDADAANKIFDRFYRVDAGRARSQGGTGLGLAIVDALVRAHGGSVSVDTKLGEGATFTVRLPEVTAEGQEPVNAV